jgi:tRNA threonylcarbamoyladenosine biosynthesis protein TsaB
LTPPTLLLAIETATEVGSLALLERGELLGERTLGPARQHAAGLLPALDQLLQSCGRRLEQVEAFALSIGPGSFTGLRVGLATALGLCFGTERCIVPVPTLAALSLHAGAAERIAPLLDARKGQVYAGLYGPDAAPLAADCVVEPLQWLETLRGAGPVHFLGPGAILHAESIRAALGDQARILPRGLGLPRSATVGRLAARLAGEGAALPPEDVRLRYLRRSDAEERERSGATA